MIFFAGDSLCFGQKLRAVALVLERARHAVSHRNCLPEYVQFSDDCGVLFGDFRSMGFLGRYPDSNVSNEDIMFGVFEGQENVSPSRPFVVDSLELDLFHVWAFAVPKVGDPDLPASDALTLHPSTRELLLNELAEISVFHAIRYPIDWYLSLYPHDPDPAWYVLFDIRDEMRGFFCGVGLVLSSLPFLIELCSRGNQAWIDLQHVRFEIRVCKNSPERVQIAFGVAAREPQHHMIPDLDSGIFQNLRCLNNISDSMISMNFLVHIIV